MSKKIFLLILLTLTLITLVSCNSTKKETNKNKITVVVSFNAVREFTYAIGKEKVNIITLVPNGTEPHDFEPTVKNLKNLSKADVFVYNGLDMESWLDKTLNSIDNKKLIVVNASKGAKPITTTDKDIVKSEGNSDPHLWLSLTGANIEAKNIKDALIKADPSNKDFYEKNYADFSNKLNTLNNEYANKFSEVNTKNFVTGHAAFAYLCRGYNLKQNSVEDVFADGEPSAKKLKDLTDYCKENNIKTVFVEDMVSPKVSNTLAKEVGAKVEKIYTIESKEDNKDYLQCMEENLDMIYKSLK